MKTTVFLVSVMFPNILPFNTTQVIIECEKKKKKKQQKIQKIKIKTPSLLSLLGFIGINCNKDIRNWFDVYIQHCVWFQQLQDKRDWNAFDLNVVSMTMYSETCILRPPLEP